MTYLEKEYSIFPIALMLASTLFFILKLLVSSMNAPWYFLKTIYGTYPLITIIFTVVGLISIFYRYKYSWIVVGLPFLWALFNPFKVMSAAFAPGQAYQFLAPLFAGYFAGPILLGFLTPIAVLTYVVMKILKTEMNKKTEIVFVIIIGLLYLIQWFI